MSFYADVTFILHQPRSIKILNVKKCSINMKAKLLCSINFRSSKRLYFLKILLSNGNLSLKFLDVSSWGFP